jgi:hypothetical protein
MFLRKPNKGVKSFQTFLKKFNWNVLNFLNLTEKRAQVKKINILKNIFTSVLALSSEIRAATYVITSVLTWYIMKNKGINFISLSVNIRKITLNMTCLEIIFECNSFMLSPPRIHFSLYT